ncbi:MAG: hypothetical protein HQK52_20535 [Oligoflexia bacterium]|nr:hypothetical protein [Oligoflexia bacterium]
MKFVDVKVFREERFSVEKDIESDRIFITFPVYNGLSEYSEFYEISNEEFNKFSNDLDLLKIFVNECKNYKHDNRLLMKPGRIRGRPPL